MQISCKLTYTAILFLEAQGLDLTELWEQSPYPEDLLSDSSFWLQASEMEAWLAQIENRYGAQVEGDLLEKIGHASPELRSWGALDSVLKMMSRPQDIWSQPAKILSYFISPEPPIENLMKKISEISFDVPIISEQYPLVSRVLRASFESLPQFVNQGFAKVTWEGIHLKISFSETDQAGLLPVRDRLQLSPTLGQDLIEALRSNQKNLEEQHRELKTKYDLAMQELQKSEKSKSFQSLSLEALASPPEINTPAIQNDLSEMASVAFEHHLSAMNDYMVRAQQLVTLLIGQDRNSPQIKLAMKKVDWEKVPENFSQKLFEARSILKRKRGE